MKNTTFLLRKIVKVPPCEKCKTIIENINIKGNNISFSERLSQTVRRFQN